jgi:putative ABC transport system substrate-binding protein
MRAVADQRGSGIAIDEYTIRGAAELPATLAAITQAKPDALIVDNEPFLASKAADIAAAGLPAISGGREFAVAGLLVAYGASIFDVLRRTGSYIDRTLKGAQPADLPIEQPTTFKLIINLKTARALGLTIPPSILARADEVIE